MKQALRQRLRKERAAFSDPEAGEILQRRVVTHPWFLEARTLALYLPVRGEPPTAKIQEAARNLGKRLVLPRVTGECLTLHPWEPELLLIPGPFGIPEPPEGTPELPVEDLDLVLVPGVAFDRRGYRLGHGKGHYDRLLANYRGYTVGIGWEFQRLEEVPRQPHDVRMRAVVTETGWWESS